MRFLFLFSTVFLCFNFLNSCSTEEVDTTTPASVQTPTTSTTETETQTETEATPTQYTLTVSAAEGGSVSSEGGTYDEGTEVTLSATPNEGYEFVGWVDRDETESELTLSINANITLTPIFQEIIVNTTSYYASGELVTIDPIIFYDRSLTVHGIKIIIAGAIGGQEAVPDAWAYKAAQAIKLLINKEAEGIDPDAQLTMIKTLLGEEGWHKGYPTGQRIAYGGGGEYNPNFLDDNRGQSYPGLEAFEDQMFLDDMVWYKNIDSRFTGDDDIAEILEHLLHTIHRFGVKGGVEGSQEALDIEIELGDISNTELFSAMMEAYENGVFDIEGYGGNINNQDAWPVMLKEYQYLLTFGMWEFSEFWEGGSLAPEWNDNARTPEGILANNPLGYALFKKYFEPVISKPSKETLRTMFQDNDQGSSGYTAD